MFREGYGVAGRSSAGTGGVSGPGGGGVDEAGTGLGGGLHAPGGALVQMSPSPRRWTPRRIAFQLGALAVGLTLFAWSVRIALSEKNRPALRALLEATPTQVASVLGLTALSIALNGLIFWSTSRPLKRLKALDLIAVNSIATFLSLLPFKLGFFTRALIHHRRDGVNFRDLLAWFSASAALALAVVVPFAAAGLWRRAADPVWALAAVGGAALCTGAGVWIAGLCERWTWLGRLGLGAHRVVRHLPSVLLHAGLRVVDLGVQSLRFWAAAAVVGVDLQGGQAVLLGTTYLLLVALAPAGALGFAEMGTAGVAVAAGLDPQTVAVIALAITGAQAVCGLVMGLSGAAWLRIDRLVLGRRTTEPGAAVPTAASGPDSLGA